MGTHSSKRLHTVPENFKDKETLRRSRLRHVQETLSESVPAGLNKLEEADDAAENENNEVQLNGDAVAQQQIAEFPPTDSPHPSQRISLMSFRQAGMYQRSASHYEQTDHIAQRVDPAEYEFEFENLVFEGGGNKGLAYCGAVRVRFGAV